jgi:hypothetical protein
LVSEPFWAWRQARHEKQSPGTGRTDDHVLRSDDEWTPGRDGHGRRAAGACCRYPHKGEYGALRTPATDVLNRLAFAPVQGATGRLRKRRRMKEDEDKARSGMTITVLEAREEISDIAGGGTPGRVVCAVGADAGDIAWADERGSENELEVAVSSGSYRSIGAICAGFRDMWPVLPIDQGLAATGSETEDPDVEMSQASVSELRRLVQAIAVTPATTVDEFMLKKEVVVECVNKYATGPASTLVLTSLFQDFDRLTDQGRSTPALLNREYSETSHIVSAQHTLCDEDVFGVCHTFWVVWSGFTEICRRVGVLDASQDVIGASRLDIDVWRSWTSLQSIIVQLAGMRSHSFDELFAKRDIGGVCLRFDFSTENIFSLVESFSRDCDRLFGPCNLDVAVAAWVLLQTLSSSPSD